MPGPEGVEAAARRLNQNTGFSLRASGFGVNNLVPKQATMLVGTVLYVLYISQVPCHVGAWYHVHGPRQQSPSRVVCSMYCTVQTQDTQTASDGMRRQSVRFSNRISYICQLAAKDHGSSRPHHSVHKLRIGR